MNFACAPFFAILYEYSGGSPPGILLTSMMAPMMLFSSVFWRLALAMYMLLLTCGSDCLSLRMRFVRQVRSPDSCKPNFRWIGIPVRTLPLLDPTKAQQAGPTLSLTGTSTYDGQPTPVGEQLVLEKSVTASTSTTTAGSAFSAASTGGSAFSAASTGDADAGAALVDVPAAAMAAGGGGNGSGSGSRTPSLAWKAVGVDKTPTSNKGNVVDGGSASLGTTTGDAWDEGDFHDIGEAWTPLAAAVAGFGVEVGWICV